MKSVLKSIVVTSVACLSLACGGPSTSGDGPNGTDLGAQASGTQSHLLTVTFASDTTVFAAGGDGVVLKSTDAGASWADVSISTDTDIQSIDFVDDNIGYAVDSNSVGNSSATIFKTTDGGASWQALTEETYQRDCPCEERGCAGVVGAPPSEETFECTRPFKAPLHGVVALSQDVVLAVGNSGYVYRTNDGGTTWGSEVIDTDVPPTLRAISCVDDTTCVTSGNIAVNPTPKGIFAISTDAGVSWTATESVDVLKMVDLSLVTESVGYGVNTAGEIHKTIDSGSSWTELAIPHIDPSEDLNLVGIHGVAFMDGSNGFAVGYWLKVQGSLDPYSLILATTDGGASWSITHAASAESTLEAVAVRNGVTVAVGLDGLIVRSAP